jgi:hypothetical protein
MQNLIPPADPLGLPSPPILFQSLAWLTLVLHMIFMNFILGGTLIVTIQEFLYGKKPEVVKANTLLIRVMPVAISLAITMGVAPLLFVQVLYGQFFYSSNVVMGGFWLAVILLVMIAFYNIYILIIKRPPEGKSSPLSKTILLINTILFFCIAFLYTNNAVLTENPEFWPEIYSKAKSFIAPDPALWGRYSHNVIGAISIAGIWIAFIGHYQRTYYPENMESAKIMIRNGLLWAIIGTFVQVLTGGVYLVLLGVDFIREFMGNGFLFVGWTISVMTSIFLIVTLLLGLLKENNGKFIWSSALLMFLTLFGMVMGRDLTRVIKLDEYFHISEHLVRPQHSSMIMFFTTFVIGLGFVAYLVYLVWSMPKAEEGEGSDY